MTNDTQTSPAIPEEWLSAYLDNELTSDEKAQVEAALEESESLRAQLDEIRGVGELLRSLPQPQLGSGFANTLPLDPPVRRNAGLPWRFGLTAGSLVAASLVAGVLWIQTDMFSDSGSLVALNDHAAERFESGVIGGGAVELESASNLPMPEAGTIASDALTSAPMIVADSGSGVASTVGVDEATNNVVAAMSTMSRGLSERLDRAVPQSGDLIHLLENVGGDVAVVEWAVLDVQEAFGDLQVTLTNLGVPASDESLGVDKNGDRFLAVYVQGDETVMQAIVSQSRRDEGLYEYRLNEAVAGPGRMSVASGPKGESQTMILQNGSVPNASYGLADIVSPTSEPAVPGSPTDLKTAVSDDESVVGSTQRGARFAGQQPDGIANRTRMEKARDFNSDKTSKVANRDFSEPQAGGRAAAAPRPASSGELRQNVTEAIESAPAKAAAPIAPEFDTRLAYQVPLQLTKASVNRILTSNSFQPTSTPQRMLIVLTESRSPAKPRP